MHQPIQYKPELGKPVVVIHVILPGVGSEVICQPTLELATRYLVRLSSLWLNRESRIYFCFIDEWRNDYWGGRHLQSRWQQYGS